MPSRRHRRSRPRLTERTPVWYRVCEIATEVLLYLTVVFGPWAFGTTEDWAIRTMNGVGYALGLLWLAKWLTCRVTGFRPSRWGADADEAATEAGTGRSPWLSVWPVRLLAVLTVSLLAWCWIGAINAAQTYVPATLERLDHPYRTWLPHSFDSRSTWYVFYQYLGLACLFWAARDWLLVKTRRERYAEIARESAAEEAAPDLPVLPAKWRRLLWVLCVNGASLGLQGILQRAGQSNELLWLRQPKWNDSWHDQFGAYAYRGNAAEYFNLVWPVCLGFWWLLHHRAQAQAHRTPGGASGPHLLLLPGTAIMAACPLVAANRTGSALAVVGMAAAAAGLTWADYRRRRRIPWAILAVVGLFVGVAVFSDVGFLLSRLELVTSDNLGGREDVYAGARKMAEDYGWLGSGPGTFAVLYPYYFPKILTHWETQAHDDWLETIITFGYAGFLLVLAALICVGIEIFRGAVGRRGPTVAPFVALSLTMCLLHAKVDFPFQVDSLLRLFTLLCCVGMCVRHLRPAQMRSGAVASRGQHLRDSSEPGTESASPS